MSLQKRTSLTEATVTLPFREIVTLPDTLSSLIHAPLRSPTRHDSSSNNSLVPIDNYWFGPVLRKADRLDKGHVELLYGMASSWAREIVTQVWTYYLPESKKVHTAAEIDDKLHLLLLRAKQESSGEGSGNQRWHDAEQSAQDCPIEYLLQRHAHDVYDFVVYLVRRSTGEQFLLADRQLQAEINRELIRNPALANTPPFQRLQTQYRQWADEAKETWANHQLTFEEIKTNLKRLRPFLDSFRRVLVTTIEEAQKLAKPTPAEEQAQEALKRAKQLEQEAERKKQEADRQFRESEDFVKKTGRKAKDIEKQAKRNASRIIARTQQEVGTAEERKAARRKLFEERLAEQIQHSQYWLQTAAEAREMLRDTLAEFSDVMTAEDWQKIDSYEPPTPGAGGDS